MTTVNVEQVLNRAFVRSYRSLGQYLLTTAWPRFDIGDEHEIRGLLEKEARLADHTAEYLIKQSGSVDTGHYSLTFCDLHFVNFSRILPEWIAAQQKLIAELSLDRKEMGDSDSEAVSHLDQMIQQEKNILGKLEAIKS